MTRCCFLWKKGQARRSSCPYQTRLAVLFSTDRLGRPSGTGSGLPVTTLGASVNASIPGSPSGGGSAGGERAGTRCCRCGSRARSCCGSRRGSSWRCCTTSRRARHAAYNPAPLLISAGPPRRYNPNPILYFLPVFPAIFLDCTLPKCNNYCMKRAQSTTLSRVPGVNLPCRLSLQPGGIAYTNLQFRPVSFIELQSARRLRRQEKRKE